MKNIVGIKNTVVDTTNKAISWFNCLKCVSKTAPSNPVPIAVVTITQNPLGQFLIEDSELQETRQACFTAYGTPIKVAQNPIKAKTLYPLIEHNTAQDKPIFIPTQKIRFQKLSLLQRDFSQFILSIFFKLKIRVADLIVPQLASFLKRIRLFTLIYFSFAAHAHSYAEELLPLIAQIEQKHNIPTGLLEAIAIVESQVKPYAICADGHSIKANSKEDAIAIVQSLLDKGVNNIDLGVMQVNLYWHGKKFKNIESMLTPKDNIEYAAKFLCELYKQHGNWNLAVRHYHSSKFEHNNKYSRKIIIAWLGN